MDWNLHLKWFKTRYAWKWKEEALKPFILLVVDRKEEGLKAANDLLQKANANPVITTGHPDFSEDMLYGKYLPNETGALYYREGFITQLMPKKDKKLFSYW